MADSKQSQSEKQRDAFNKSASAQNFLTDKQLREGEENQQKFSFNGLPDTSFALGRLMQGTDSQKQDAFDAANSATKKRDEYQQEHGDQQPNHDEALEQSPLYQGLSKNAADMKKQYGENSAQYMQANSLQQMTGALVEEQNGTPTDHEQKLLQGAASSPDSKRGMDRLASFVSKENGTDGLSQQAQVTPTAYSPAGVSTVAGSQSSVVSQQPQVSQQGGSTVIVAQPGTTVIVAGNGQGLNRGVQSSSIQSDPTSFDSRMEGQLEQGLIGVQKGQLQPFDFNRNASQLALSASDPQVAQRMAKGIQSNSKSDSRLYDVTPAGQKQMQDNKSKKLDIDTSKEIQM